MKYLFLPILLFSQLSFGSYITPKAPVIDQTQSVQAAGNFSAVSNYWFDLGGSHSATVGATYTSANGSVFTVTTTISSKIKMIMTGAVDPDASGNLTKTSGTGDSPIAYNRWVPMGVYTTPTAPKPLYLKVKLVGTGGGGGGISNHQGGDGRETLLVTSPSAYLMADGGYGGGGSTTATPGSPGQGGTFGNFVLPATSFLLNGAYGSYGEFGVYSTSDLTNGSNGGPGGPGGCGGGGGKGGLGGGAGSDGSAYGGGGGGGSGGSTSIGSSAGGGGGGCEEIIINSPLATYYYGISSVGGSGGSGGAVAGGGGAAGWISIEAHYQ